MKNLFPPVTIAAFLCFGIIAIQLLWQKPEPRQVDERFYLVLAHDLYEFGVFTSATARGTGQSGEVPQPDNYIVPAYPALLAAIAVFDPEMRKQMRCAVGPIGDCMATLPLSLILIQAVLLAGATLFTFNAYRHLNPRPAFAYTALVCLLAVGLQARLATSILPDGLSLAAFMVLAGCLVTALRSKGAQSWLAVGAVIGLGALIRPSTFYLVFMMIPVVLFATRSVRGSIAMLIGFTIVLTPWILRNVLIVDSLSFTGSYGGITLAQRVAYNAMTPVEWGAALIYWLPDFGDSLAASLFPIEAYQRLDFSTQNGFYRIGNTALMAEALSRAGGPQGLTGVLIKDWILAHPLTHIATTIPIFLRGLWVAKYVGLAAILLLIPVVTGLWRQGRAKNFLILASPFFLMAGFHAGISINIPRYNYSLVIIYAALFAYAGFYIWDRVNRAPTSTAINQD
jgi:hypothetical protein